MASSENLPLPRKSEGSSLSAAHVNKLNEAARLLLRHSHGSGLFGTRRVTASPPPFVQRPVIITASGCDGNASLYTIKFRYWDSVDNVWATDTNNADGWCLDPTEFGVSLDVDDKVIAYYDPQRGAFIPLPCSQSCEGSSQSSSSIPPPPYVECKGIQTQHVWKLVTGAEDTVICYPVSSMPGIANEWEGLHGITPNYPSEVCSVRAEVFGSCTLSGSTTYTISFDPDDPNQIAGSTAVLSVFTSPFTFYYYSSDSLEGVLTFYSTIPPTGGALYRAYPINAEEVQKTNWCVTSGYNANNNQPCGGDPCEKSIGGGNCNCKVDMVTVVLNHRTKLIASDDRYGVMIVDLVGPDGACAGESGGSESPYIKFTYNRDTCTIEHKLSGGTISATLTTSTPIWFFENIGSPDWPSPPPVEDSFYVPFVEAFANICTTYGTTGYTTRALYKAAT